MALTVKLTESVSEGNTEINNVRTHTCDQVAKLDESVADAETDLYHAFGVDVSELIVFYMLADGVLTVETNSGSSPQETFTLAAGVPVEWQTGDTAIFAGDVTGLYLSNSTGSAVRLQIIAGSNV